MKVRGNSCRPLHIWMVTPEMSGIKKTGGLADAVTGLSEGLAGLGHTVTAVMPKHLGTLELFLRAKFNLNYFDDMIVPVGDLRTPTSIIRGSIKDENNGFNLNAFFLDTADATAFGSRTRLYGYNDDAFRFFFFNRAIHELYCKFLQEKNRSKFVPDIIHCHDWQTGFTPFLFNYFGPHDSKVRTVYNIHNLGYSCGDRNMDPWTFAHKIGVPTWGDARLFGPDGLEFYGRIEPHKAAILFADRVIAVSPDYAEELRTGRTDEPGSLYASIFGRRGTDFDGKLNGLPDYFGPEHFAKQGIIPSNYSSDNLEGRWANREALQGKFGLPRDPEAMILAWTSRLAHQKGTDIALQALPEILAGQPKVQVVFVADGEQQFKDTINSLANEFPDRVRYSPFNENLEILTLAGSELIWIPSRFEPCGLNQMKGQKLGSAPWGRETGGLKSTIRHGETGFSFWELSPQTMAKQLLQDIWLAYQNKEFWQGMKANMMRLEYSWAAQAQSYVDSFREALAAPRRRWPF